VSIIDDDVHCAAGVDAVTESLPQLSLSETGVMLSLSQLITVGCQLQQNLTHLLVSAPSLFLFLSEVVNVPSAEQVCVIKVGL